MIINCPNCNKKFQLDHNLIPNNGRMLQCGSCDNRWFFKNENELEDEEVRIEEKVIIEEKESEFQKKPTITENIIKKENDYDNIDLNKVKKNNINYFKVILIIIISLIALIVILDTFKESLTSIFPNIEIVLDNLYQSLKDIKLFMLDLAK